MYKLIGVDDSQGVIRIADGLGIPPDERNRDWREYLAWVDAGGVPDPAYDLPEAKALCTARAISDYEAALLEPISDGVDMIDMSPQARQKITTARQTGKANVKARRVGGRPKSYSQAELDDLIDLIDDRDDTLLDGLDATLDAIEDAETLEELAPYMPGG